MKKLYLIVFISVLFILSCEDKKYLPHISVTNLEDEMHVYGKVLIEVYSWALNKVEYVELLVNENSTGVRDSISP